MIRPITSGLCITFIVVALTSCDLIQWKKNQPDNPERKAIARVNNTYLYKDEIAGIVTDKITGEDSTARINSYINSWIRKQLLISEATKHILSTACPSVLFPYARESVSNLVQRGGFPQLLLPPINFEAMYAQHLAQAQTEQTKDSAKQ